jgi:hypothetical protein
MWRGAHNENIKPSAQNQNSTPIVENGDGTVMIFFSCVV